MYVNLRFRTELQKLYHKCLLSNMDIIECDAAHIIPLYICYKLSLHDLIDDISNGLFLCKNLHYSFDNYIWCFDVHDVAWENNDYYSISIITISNKKQYTINFYADQRIKLPNKTLPFIWTRYHIFMNHHYTDCDMTDKYRELLGSDEYHKLRLNPQNLSLMTPINKPEIVLKKKPYDNIYLVLNKNSPWRSRHWTDQLDSTLMVKYENYHQKKIDPDWSNL